VRLHVEVWPDDWYAETLTDRWEIDSRSTLQLRGAAFRRPDQVFYGLGPESAQYHQSRFTEAQLDASAMLQSYVWRSTRLELQGGLRKVDLSPGHYGSDPSLEAEARLHGAVRARARVVRHARAKLDDGLGRSDRSAGRRRR